MFEFPLTKEQEVNVYQLIMALRSGKYPQGKGHLKGIGSGGYCPLGVACEISGLGRWRAMGLVLAFILKNDFAATQLPEAVRKHYGFKSRYPKTKDGKSIVSLNDDERLPFEQIAEIIEQEVLNK